MKKFRLLLQKFDLYQLGTLLLLVVLAWFSFESSPSEIKIGIILPLTGPSSARAIAHKQGILLAIEHVNQAGGINGKTLKPLIKDNEGNPTQTAIICRNLIYEEKVLTLVGGISPESSRIIQQFSEQSHTPYLTALCTHYELTANGSKYSFRSITDDVKQFLAICEYSARRFKTRKPALIYDPLIYGSDSAQKFIEAALKNQQQVVAAVSYRNGTLNFRRQLEIIEASNPDALFIIAPPKDSALILRQAREARFTKPILGANPLSSHEFIEFAGIYSESAICTLPFNSRLGGQRAEYFLAEYVEKWGESADSDAALGYEAVMLTALALKAGEYNKEMVRNYFASMHGWESVTGSGGFDQNGNQVRPAEVAIIKDRQKIPVNLEELF
ncbi:MAG: ABC transporter substrate-binding protein [Candidatus Rifleibacteriota bacterium]